MSEHSCYAYVHDLFRHQCCLLYAAYTNQNKMKPTVADTTPIRVELEAGKTYAYCTCGLSDKQPFCNGAHKGSDFSPKIFKAEESKTVSMCRCKQTGNPGFCDGSHKQL